MNNVNSIKTRVPGLDFLRASAIFFVVAGHFSLNTEFASSVFGGISMWLQAIFRNLFISGVPVFIMLTGYLNANKVEVNGKYYKGLIRVLVSYLLFSIITIIFRKCCLGETASLLGWGLKILDFSAIPYAWYIEMWLGLFVLTPFLNMLWRSIPERRQKIILIGTLFVLTALPDFFNRYGVHLVPGFWHGIYPLTYFYIGSYIREYQPKINFSLGGGIILACSLINPVFNALFLDNHDMVEISGGQNGPFGILVAVSFFLMFYDRKINFPGMRKISLLSLDMYLVSYIFDKLYYTYFRENCFENQSQFGKFFFIIVPLVFLSSFAVAWIKDMIFRLPEKIRGVRK